MPSREIPFDTKWLGLRRLTYTFLWGISRRRRMDIGAFPRNSEIWGSALEPAKRSVIWQRPSSIWIT